MPTAGHVLKDLAGRRRQRRGGPRRQRGQGQPALQKRHQSRSAPDHARRRRRIAAADARAQGHRRRRPDRQTQRRQEHAAEPPVAGPARNRRLSVHHQVSQPGHRADRTRPLVRDGRHSGPDRRGARRAPAWGTSSCGTSSGPASWCTWSSPCRPTAAIRWRTIGSSAANWSSMMSSWRGGPRSWRSPRPSCPAPDETARQLRDAIGREVLAISAVTGQGLDRLLRAIARALDAQGDDRSRRQSLSTAAA